VKENDAGSVICLEARLKDMHPETVDVIDEARSYARGRSAGLYGNSVALVVDDCWGAAIERDSLISAAGARTVARP
jgi:hypothetical protein